MAIEENLNHLPQYDGYWYTGFRRIPAWIHNENEEGEEYFQPWVVFCVDMHSGAILQIILLEEMPDLDDIYQFLSNTMTTPAENSVHPQRPKEIHFEYEDLTEDMQPRLTPLMIKTVYNPQTEVVDDIIVQLYPVITQGQIPLPGLTEQRGVKPELVKNLFLLSKHFWDLKPWEKLENEDILEVKVGSQKNPYLISMMGYGGMEFGFALFKSKTELQTFFVQTELKSHKIPAAGRHVFIFNKPPLVSFDDLYEIKKHQLAMPEGGYIPTPLLFKPDDLHRPSLQMVRWYEAFLSAFPAFFEDYLHMNAKKISKTYPVTTSKEDIQVKIKFPAYARKTIHHWKIDGVLKLMGGMFQNLNR